MKGSVPTNILGSDLLRRRYIRDMSPHQVAPMVEVGVSHSFRVLSLQRNDMRPDRALMVRHLFRDLIKHKRLICFRKQPVRVRTGIQIVHEYLAVKLLTDFWLWRRFFHTLTGCDIFYIISEPFVRVRLDVAAGDDNFWQCPPPKQKSGTAKKQSRRILYYLIAYRSTDPFTLSLTT